MMRPMSRIGSGRPFTAPHPQPPSTALRVGTGMVPGTGGHPTMRGSPVAISGVMSPQIKVMDRPVKQQGLSGMKTGKKGPQRQILDKSYYLGLLRSKINELTTETSKMHKEIDNFNQENSVYLSYERRAEGLAEEIKDFQGQLSDYNMLVDKLNTNTEMEQMVNDYNILKAQNDQKAESIENIFTERKKREETIQGVEQSIQRERRVAKKVVQSMPRVRQEKYNTMTTSNEELLRELAVLQEELDILLTRKEDYEIELSHSLIKQEVVRLHKTLSSLELKRDAMEAEQNNISSPQEERDKLFKQVKEDNQEIASMERQLAQLRDRTMQITEELEQDSEDAQWKSHQQYNKLKKREEQIDSFNKAFEETKQRELDKLRQTQQNIVHLLETSSQNIGRLQRMDSVTATELKNIQEVLVNKETEVNQSQSTAMNLTSESRRLKRDLEKVDQLEVKISSEIEWYREQLSTMEMELKIYRDIDTLKRRAEAKKKKLEQQCVSMSQRQECFRQLQSDISNKYKALKAKLDENEIHAQLTNLEKKWQHLERNNFAMKEFIASKSQETDYTPVAKRVTQQVAEYNKTLLESLKNNMTLT